VKYWRTVSRLEKKAIKDEELLKDILKQIPPDYDIFQGHPNGTTNKQLLQARKYCSKCRNNSYKLRQDFLEQLADELMEEDDTQDRAVIVHKIRDAESKRRMYAVMKKYFKPGNKAGITHLDVPEWDKFELICIMCFATPFYNMPHIQWWMTITCLVMFHKLIDIRATFLDWISYRRIVIKEEMESALFQQHVHHFSQAKGTPFTKAPILDIFGELAEKPKGELYRKGQLNIDELDIDQYTKEFLQDLQRQPDDPPFIDTTVTPQEFCNQYKIWKETTSTSPSGRYLSLYKTWVKVPEETDPSYTGLTSTEFFTFITTIMGIAARHKYPLA
jgi:hypothetical protein